MIVITGANGFLGRQVVQAFSGRDILPLLGSSYLDLRDRSATLDWFSEQYNKGPIDGIISCAATVGGIGFNNSNPATIAFDNMKIGLNTLEAATIFKCKKLVQIGTVCGYPAHCPTPFQESEIGNGLPEPTNRAYGLCKNLLVEMSVAAKKEFGLNTVNLYPCNMFGSGDNYTNPHVIPDLIAKFSRAKKLGLPSVTLYGTGEESREFLDVKECARAIRLAYDNWNDPAPVNIGTGKSTKIKDLAAKISDLVSFKGEILWSGELGGQFNRQLDVSRAKQFGFECNQDFDVILGQMVREYKCSY